MADKLKRFQAFVYDPDFGTTICAEADHLDELATACGKARQTNVESVMDLQERIWLPDKELKQFNQVVYAEYCTAHPPVQGPETKEVSEFQQMQLSMLMLGNSELNNGRFHHYESGPLTTGVDAKIRESNSLTAD